MNQSESRSTRWFVAAGLALAAILVIWLIFFGKSDPEPNPIDAAKLLQLKNQAIGQLENIPNDDKNDGSESTTAFAELTHQLPDELLGPRNLAIASLLSLEKVDKNTAQAKFEQLAEKCQAAVEQLKTVDTKSGIADLLAAKLAMARDDDQAAAKHYEVACNKMPNDFVPWAELFMLVRDSKEVDLRKRALQQAYAANSDNLVLLEHLVSLQAQSRDPAILETLKTAKRIMQPLASVIEKQQIQLDSELSSIAKRIEAGDDQAWSDIRIRMIQVFNVVRPELIYQADLSQLSRHVLEYVIHDFSEDFYKQYPEVRVNAAEDNPITVSAVDGQQLSDITDASDIALFDFDLDDKLDVAVLRKTTVEIYRHRGPDGWELLTQCPVPVGMERLLVADLDRDAQKKNAAGFEISDEDLVVYGSGGYRFLENRQAAAPEKRQFVERENPLTLDPDQAIVQPLPSDIDHDGDLDLVIASSTGMSLWINQEKWTFTERTATSLMEGNETGKPVSLAAVDWDRNVLADVLVGYEKGPLAKLENIRHGRLRWQSLDPKIGPADGVNQLLPCEMDGKASWDLLTAHDKGISLTLTATRPGESVWTTRTVEVSNVPTLGVRRWDPDNNGIADILAWGNEGVQIYLGKGSGQFSNPLPATGIADGPVRTCAVGDIDDDGDEDLVLIVGNTPQWCINNGGNRNNWIDVRLCAEADPKLQAQRTNLFGIGSLVELRVGEQYQAQLVSGQVTHFGIGKQKQADVVRVLWTNGIPQNVISPKSNLAVTEKQRLLKGSCPYLYTWTGDRYEFFTDLLWAAPIGLQLAEGLVAPTRDWEYLLIPGEKLRAVEGEYRMQVTEELWEAAYFDQVALIAIDHPADISIFSNEKVGPPNVSQFQVHAIPTSRLVAPVAARNDQGQDVLSVISHRDGRYLKLFDHRLKQGLTNKYFLELNLGELEDPQQVKLVMTGWVFPTDTSVNVAISQNPALEPPQPPALWVPDPAQATGWKQVVPHMGFPGGKTKTIVVDIPADQFVGNDYRVRMESSMELYWDSILVAVDAEPGKFQQTPLPLVDADLHERGFSARYPGRNHGPEQYDYEQVSQQPAWPPMAGNFTRYGNVTELLKETDSHLVVLGAGDEMTLRFAQPANPLPTGWKRDFLLYNVGWDKDADLNTVLGHHVDPLPYPGMSSYPPGLNDEIPNSAAYQQYLRTYQTRSYSQQQFWNQLQQPGPR